MASPPQTAPGSGRRQRVGKMLVFLGVAAIAVNVVLLVSEGGSSLPQAINVALGVVLLAFGIQFLRDKSS